LKLGVSDKVASILDFKDKSLLRFPCNLLLLNVRTWKSNSKKRV